jgi:hypothetical protein
VWGCSEWSTQDKGRRRNLTRMEVPHVPMSQCPIDPCKHAGEVRACMRSRPEKAACSPDRPQVFGLQVRLVALCLARVGLCPEMGARIRGCAKGAPRVSPAILFRSQHAIKAAPSLRPSYLPIARPIAHCPYTFAVPPFCPLSRFIWVGSRAQQKSELAIWLWLELHGSSTVSPPFWGPPRTLSNASKNG